MQPDVPESVGMSSRRLGRLNDVMQGLVDGNHLAGIVTLVARKGQVVSHRSFGQMDVASAKKMQPDTIFRIASMTKPITSVAAMILFERGQFLLTDPVSAYLPEFVELSVLATDSPGGQEPASAITIWHLLTHTSGLGYPESDDGPVSALYQAARPNASRSLSELAQKLAGLPLFAHPGSRWHYGYSQDVLARLLEVVSGMEFGELLKQEIFDPLGMCDTAHVVPERNGDRLATIYGPAEEGGLAPLDLQTAGDVRPPGLKPGGHGLFSTGPDYLRFAQMLLNGGQIDGIQILSRKSVELMTANHLPPDLLPIQFSPEYVLHGHGYGLGLGVILDPAADKLPGSAGSYYWTGATNTLFWVDPREDIIGIFLSQFMPTGLRPVRKQFRVLVYQAIVD